MSVSVEQSQSVDKSAQTDIAAPTLMKGREGEKKNTHGDGR